MSNIIDGTAEFQAVDARAAAIFDLIYPVGAVFATTGNAPARGTWEEIAQGRTLQGADSSHSVGTTIEAGLPELYGSTNALAFQGVTQQAGVQIGDGVFKSIQAYGASIVTTGGANSTLLKFRASDANPIYGNSSTVQPPAYVVHFYRRIA